MSEKAEDLRPSSEWSDWNNHIVNCRGSVGGGIYTHKGAVCSQDGIFLPPSQILNIADCFDGEGSSVKIDDTKYLMISKDSEIVQFRSGNVPVIAMKTKFLLIVALGEANSAADLLADLEMVSKQLKIAGV